MRWGRLLRWGRVGFLRRRLPYLHYSIASPLRNALFLATHPQVLRLSVAVRRAVREGDGVLAA